MAQSDKRRIVFTGPRSWGRSGVERAAAWVEIDKYGEQGFTLVQGGAAGLDRLVIDRCIEKGYRLETHFARWDDHGRAAGPIRNAKMLALDGVEKVVGFRRRGTDGWSKGTGHCVKTAKELGLPVVVVEA